MVRCWNKADYLLAAITATFCVLLFIKIRFPETIIINGLFFACEAALVGGIADWFAVTALFKKPLGFPYHTALLPRNRQKFTQACVRMIQDEFFSRKKLLMKIKKLHLVEILLDWLVRSGGREMIAGILLDSLEKLLNKMQHEQVVEKLEVDIKVWLSRLPQDKIYDEINCWLQKDNRANGLFDLVLAEAISKLSTPAMKIKIWDFLQEYVDAKSRSLAAVLFTLVAQVSNIINYEEAAELLQKRLLQFLYELQPIDNPLRIRLMAQLGDSLGEMVADENWQQMIEAWRQEVLLTTELQPTINRCIVAISKDLQRQPARENEVLPAKQTVLAKVVLDEIDRTLSVIEHNSAVHEALERLLYDLVGRSVLQAQSLIGVIVDEALSKLSDKEMNRLIYSKVEADLLWIRMNGSIVGALVGLVIFAILTWCK